MADVSFWAGSQFVINNLAGSGLGFYGDGGFGASVLVAAYQDNTYITNGAGTAQGPLCDNIKFINAQSGEVNTETSGRLLTTIPNYLATLNIRFTHSTAIKTQNAKLRIYDRSNINNNPSGLTAKTAEFIHTNTVFDNTGSGASSWVTPRGSSVVHSLVASPGQSGYRQNGPNTTSTQHDWYVAVSESPDSIGAKTLNGLYFSVEYL